MKEAASFVLDYSYAHCTANATSMVILATLVMEDRIVL